MKRKLVLIFIAFCTSFIVMVTLSFFSIERYTTFTEYSADVVHSNLVIRMLYKTEVYLKDIDRWERGYILTNDTSYLRTVKSAIDSLEPSLDILGRLVIGNPLQTKNIIFLKKSIDSRIQFALKNLAYIDSAHSRSASPYYFEGRKFMIASNQTINAMHDVEDSLLSDRFKKQQFYEQLATNTLKTLLFIFCIVTLVLFMLLMKLIRSGMLYQEELQAKVIDLKRSHGDLQDIAYAISHDLQEPLRKIQVFSNMLMIRKNSGNEETNQNTLQRINTSAGKMQVLISNLVSLTNLAETNESKKICDLNKIVDEVITEMSEEIYNKKAYVNFERMPEITGYEQQLKILFKSMLDNSLKFSRQGTIPKIYFTYNVVTGSKLKDINAAQQKQKFRCISVIDNGIGFDNKHLSNIFKIFRRLHAEQSQYEGKGIGLAICQRVMANHEGYIIGEGIPNEGAVFELYFPMEQ
jgi:signal transduction histidine kinase